MLSIERRDEFSAFAEFSAKRASVSARRFIYMVIEESNREKF